MTNKNAELYFKISDPKNVSISNVQASVAEAWNDIRKPGTAAHAKALSLGINVDELPGASEAIEVRPVGAGIGTVDLLVAGLLVKMTYDVWKSVWTEIIFPKIKRDLGVNAIVPQQGTSKDQS